MRKIVLLFFFLAVCVHWVLGVIDYVILMRVVTRKFLDTIVCRDLQMLKEEQKILLLLSSVISFNLGISSYSNVFKFQVC
jgi:hypothetical protein